MRKGYKRPPFSEEWKRRLSESHKGKPSLNKGTKHTSEAIAKMKESHKGFKHTEEAKEKIRLTSTGRKHSEEAKLKISLWHTGKKFKSPSIETRMKMSLAKRGEKAYQWKGGIRTENMKIRGSIEFRLWREAVFARDNWTCQECSERGGVLNAHHIKRFSLYPELRTSIENGITLCKKCHVEKHKTKQIQSDLAEIKLTLKKVK